MIKKLISAYFYWSRAWAMRRLIRGQQLPMKVAVRKWWGYALQLPDQTKGEGL